MLKGVSMSDLMANSRRRWLAACFVALAVATGHAQAPAATNSFMITFLGVQIGHEDMTFSETVNGWKVSSTGVQGPPANLVINRFEVTYSKDWQPLAAAMEGTQNGQVFEHTTSFGPTSATTTSLVRGTTTTATQQVSPKTILLPNNFFAAYEVVAARLVDAQPGTTLPAYVLPKTETTIKLDSVAPKRIQTPSGTVDVVQLMTTVDNAGAPVQVELWVDSKHRLARVAMPASSLLVIRDDLSSVMARVENIKNPGESSATIPALGFSLAATVTRPVNAPPGSLSPAVVLVGSAGTSDRDELVSGVPIFGQIAAALADAGFVVVRYDKRGVGQSGGRVESAALVDYADDATAVVSWVRRQKGVDADRVAILGRAEGGPVAMLASARSKQIAALALVGAPGLTGREITLRQQQEALAHMSDSDPDKAQKRALEEQMVNAVINGTGWTGISADLRAEADTPWFKSWLLFDPARVMKNISQPMLILAGALDTQMFAESADHLEAQSQSRNLKDSSFVRKVVVPGVDQSLIGAGGPAANRAVSPQVTAALIAWLKDMMPSHRK